jgi:soluble lytic murein transglycosylase-like protein
MPRRSVQDVIRETAAAAGIPAELALAVAEQESQFNPTAIGQPIEVGGRPTRAIGTFQILPETAALLGGNPYDSADNIRMGAAYLRQLMDRHRGDLDKVLATYGGVVHNTTYVPQVRARMAKFARPRGTPAASAAPGGPPAPPGATPAAAPGGALLDVSVPIDPATGRPREINLVKDVAGAAKRAGTAMVEGFDPRKPEGRLNLGSTAGSIVGGVGGGYLGERYGKTEGMLWGSRAGSAAGAGLGGAAVQALEESGVFGPPPPLPPGTTALDRIGGVAAEQAGWDLAGQGVLHAIGVPVKRITQSTVGRYFFDWLEDQKRGTMLQLQDGMDALRRSAQELGITRARVQADVSLQASRDLRATGRTAREATEATRLQGDAAVADAQRRAAEALGVARTAQDTNIEAAERAAQQSIDAFERQYGVTPGPATPGGFNAGVPELREIPTGQQVASVYENYSTKVKKAIGDRMDEAARAGPKLNATALKRDTITMLREIVPSEQGFPRRIPPLENAPGRMPAHLDAPPGTLEPGDVAQVVPVRGGVQPGAMPEPDPGDWLYRLNRRISREEATALAQNPAMSLIKRITNAPNVVTFEEAHRWKQELQSLLRSKGYYESASRDRVSGLTDKVASELRAMLSVHEPYNQATAAYERIAPIFEGPAGELIRAEARDAPHKIAQMIKADDPTTAGFLVSLMTDQAEEGAGFAALRPGATQAEIAAARAQGREAGHQALNGVIDSWVRRNLVEGGSKTLRDRLDGLYARPEFVEAFLSTPYGRMRLQNLERIASAQAVFEHQTATELAAAKSAAAAGVESAKAAGEGSVEAARQRAEAALRGTKAQGVERVRTVREAGEDARQAATRETQDLRLSKADELRAQRKTMRETAAGVGNVQEERFRKSTLSTSNRDPKYLEAAFLNALRLTPVRWGGQSLGRFVAGASDADMIEFLSKSPFLTRMAVRGTLQPWLAEPVAHGVVEPGYEAYQGQPKRP